MKELPEGLQYRVTHVRKWKKLHPDAVVGRVEAMSKGGQTIVEIGEVILKDGKFDRFDPIVRGEARCHSNEFYNRKLGRDVALGRALKALEAEGYTLVKK